MLWRAGEWEPARSSREHGWRDTASRHVPVTIGEDSGNLSCSASLWGCRAACAPRSPAGRAAPNGRLYPPPWAQGFVTRSGEGLVARWCWWPWKGQGWGWPGVQAGPSAEFMEGSI